MRAHRGFTLIELSIVLVIIGLIVGGVLAGKELIKAAEIRKTISQRDQFDAATNTFRLKYNCLPGDCPNAAAFGVGVAGTGVYGENGDGNGLIDYSSTLVIYEHINFWYHLSAAKLINWEPKSNAYAFNVICNIDGVNPCLSLNSGSAYNSASAGWNLILSNTSYMGAMPYNLSNHHYWIAGRISSGNDDSAVLIPADAYAIDSKIDDGLPLAGSVRAVGDITQDPYGPNEVTPAPGGSGNDSCVDSNTTPNSYNIANTNRTNANLCGLLIRTSF